jgi:hypothetical protein
MQHAHDFLFVTCAQFDVNFVVIVFQVSRTAEKSSSDLCP